MSLKCLSELFLSDCQHLLRPCGCVFVCVRACVFVFLVPGSQLSPRCSATHWFFLPPTPLCLTMFTELQSPYFWSASRFVWHFRPFVACDAAQPHLYSQGFSKGGYRLQPATFGALCHHWLATHLVANRWVNSRRISYKGMQSLVAHRVAPCVA